MGWLGGKTMRTSGVGAERVSLGPRRMPVRWVPLTMRVKSSILRPLRFWRALLKTCTVTVACWAVRKLLRRRRSVSWKVVEWTTDLCCGRVGGIDGWGRDPAWDLGAEAGCRGEGQDQRAEKGSYSSYRGRHRGYRGEIIVAGWRGGRESRERAGGGVRTELRLSAFFFY